MQNWDRRIIFMENSKKILFIEDDVDSAEAIFLLLTKSEYKVDLVHNGKEAIEKLQTNRYSIILTDLNMPVMTGEEFIYSLRSLDVHSLIIVQTSNTERNKVIELMREGVYDYISKPYKSEELLHRINLATECYELRRFSAMVEEERKARMEAQLNWNLWRDRSLKKDADTIDSGLIESIRTSLSQSSGFGSLVSLVQLIKSKAKEDEKNYIVPKTLMEMLYENGDIARKIVENFEELDQILQVDLKKESQTIEELIQIMEYAVQSVEESRKIDNFTIKIAKGQLHKTTSRIQIHPEYIKRAFLELLYNSFKFSKKNSTVYIIFEVHKNLLKISFLTDPKLDGRGNLGIPENLQKLIFEPFFRISKYVYEQYPTLDYGIGLTFVDKVVRRHGGDIHAYMVKSHLNDSSNTELVNIEIELPLEE
jgi:CheY-like chemotaxis protein